MENKLHRSLKLSSLLTVIHPIVENIQIHTGYFSVQDIQKKLQLSTIINKVRFQPWQQPVSGVLLQFFNLKSWNISTPERSKWLGIIVQQNQVKESILYQWLNVQHSKETNLKKHLSTYQNVPLHWISTECPTVNQEMSPKFRQPAPVHSTNPSALLLWPTRVIPVAKMLHPSG